MRRTVLILLIGLGVAGSLSAQDSLIIFPHAFAFAIDDMGWNIGNDQGDVDGVGPYRIGVNRKMDVKDYKAIVDVAKEAGVRIQGLFVLAEMDRENILANHPSATWQGSSWNNSKNIGQEQIDVMNFVKENAAYLEFGLHGVGHEHWLEGLKKRAEWYCTEDDHPWEEDTVKTHIQLFKDISAQYGISEAEGHSFPESFVPCAYGYYWNPEDTYSTGSVMAEAGVKYVNTLFDYIRELNPPAEPNGGGFDNGVVVVNRINYGNPWYALASLPTVDISEQESNIIESHWSNWLAQDEFLQEQVNESWIAYYRMVQSTNDRYVAKNTEQFFSQWLYNKFTKVSEKEAGIVKIDNTKMPNEYYEYKLLGNMVLKVKLNEGEHVSKATINNKPVASYFEEAGYGFMYLPQLGQEEFVLNYLISENKMPFVVFNDATYNVYNVSKKKKSALIKLRVYGQQEVKVWCKSPKAVISDNPDLEITNTKYNAEEGLFVMTIKAHDIQGETGTLIFNY